MLRQDIMIESFLRDIPDFPKPGIVFKDITPLLAHPEARAKVVGDIASHFATKQIEALAAVEARGFIFGSMIAEALRVPFIPVRKEGKLPYHKIKEEYSLEYGSAVIEMHADAIRSGMRVLIHDDLLATGGTAAAAARMIRRLNGVVAGFSFVINLSFLPGEKLLTEKFGEKPHYLVNYI
jgi:adenine phosphoribosyltransferase